MRVFLAAKTDEQRLCTLGGGRIDPLESVQCLRRSGYVRGSTRLITCRPRRWVGADIAILPT